MSPELQAAFSAPARRRVGDRSLAFQVWCALPLVESATGVLSLTRIASAAFMVEELHLLRTQFAVIFGGALVAGVFLALVVVTMAYALGGKVFEAVALGALGRYTKTETNTNTNTQTKEVTIDKPLAPGDKP